MKSYIQANAAVFVAAAFLMLPFAAQQELSRERGCKDSWADDRPRSKCRKLKKRKDKRRRK